MLLEGFPESVDTRKDRKNLLQLPAKKRAGTCSTLCNPQCSPLFRLIDFFKGPLILFFDVKTGRPLIDLREKASLGVRKDFVVSFRAIICVCKKG